MMNITEKGFYHSSCGYWQTNSTPSDDILAAYPEGYIEVPLKPSANHVLINGVWLYEEPNIGTEELIKQYESVLDTFLDNTAKEYQFKDRHSLALRAAYPNQWQALGLAFGEWMDGVNVQAYALLNEVLSGTTPMPTVEEFLADLPVFVAP